MFLIYVVVENTRDSSVLWILVDSGEWKDVSFVTKKKTMPLWKRLPDTIFLSLSFKCLFYHTIPSAVMKSIFQSHLNTI